MTAISEYFSPCQSWISTLNEKPCFVFFFFFLQDVLGQIVLIRLPDPVTLGRDPDSETSLAGMQTLLLLVLGCAVQGPRKEIVIEDIKRLPLVTQHDIVNCIQQVKANSVPFRHPFSEYIWLVFLRDRINTIPKDDPKWNEIRCVLVSRSFVAKERGRQ